jgi:uncharacterized protein with PIN domain
MPLANLKRCANCNSAHLRRSHRKNLLERILSAIMLPYRCHYCYQRFFRPRWRKISDA